MKKMLTAIFTTLFVFGLEEFGCAGNISYDNISGVITAEVNGQIKEISEGSLVSFVGSSGVYLRRGNSFISFGGTDPMIAMGYYQINKSGKIVVDFGRIVTLDESQTKFIEQSMFKIVGRSISLTNKPAIPINNIHIYDDVDTWENLAGKSDYDRSSERRIVLRWQYNSEELNDVVDFHVYLSVNGSPAKFLGRTANNDQYFIFANENISLGADSILAKGPVLNNEYGFVIFSFHKGKTRFHSRFGDVFVNYQAAVIKTEPDSNLPTPIRTNTPTPTHQNFPTPTRTNTPTATPVVAGYIEVQQGWNLLLEYDNENYRFVVKNPEEYLESGVAIPAENNNRRPWLVDDSWNFIVQGSINTPGSWEFNCSSLEKNKVYHVFVALRDGDEKMEDVEGKDWLIYEKFVTADKSFCDDNKAIVIKVDASGNIRMGL